MTTVEFQKNTHASQRTDWFFGIGICVVFLGLVTLFAGKLHLYSLAIGCPLCGLGSVVIWYSIRLSRTVFPDFDIEFVGDKTNVQRTVRIPDTGYHEAIGTVTNFTKEMDERSISFEREYRNKISEIETFLRNAVPAREPDIDPQDVLDRLHDLDVNATTSVDANGAVTVVLRKKPAHGNEVVVAG